MLAKSNGIQVNYEVEGSGPWVVFSHSLACSTAMWDEQVAALKGKYRCLRFDTRGHGRTDAPAGAYSLDQLADDLHGMLQAVGVEQPHFVGLSMGGMIGMTYALRHPTAFRSLVLCDTSSRMGPEAAPIWQDRIATVQSKGMGAMVESTLKRWFTEPFLAQKPPAIEQTANMIRDTPAQGYIGCCHAIPKIDLTDKLGAIKIPTLVIVGEQDVGTPVAMAEAIHKAIPGSQLKVIPNASHISNMEQPQVFNEALEKFLAKA